LALLMSWNNGIIRWLLDHPLDVLKYSGDWKGIMAVVDFFLAEDASPYYIRNLPVPVHTKFVDKHASLILSILQLLDPEKFPPEVKNLEAAAGLRKKPHLYPIRWLDAMLAKNCTAGLEVLALPFSTLQNAAWKVEELWVVENETNLYLLPERKNALAVFAKGYALHRLKDIPFFSAARIFYWGDLDEDGYIMLEQFRRYYPHTTSLLMDEKTVLDHIEQIESIHYRYCRPSLQLHPSELAGYHLLLNKQGRIEQEKLQMVYVQRRIEEQT
ncbi:MAG: hypothetical protein JST42_22435, partial [Bacteroidetes bacterium]|nr:hypothetical protein [Bacteroidota bacterium]